MKKKKITLFDLCNTAVFLVIAFICIFPFYFMFINTISDPSEITRGNVTFYPVGIQFRNYTNILKDSAVWNAAFISVSRTVLGTLLTLFVTSFFAYLMTKREMFLRTVIYRYMAVTMYFSAGLIPWYLTMKTLGLRENFLVYIIPGALSAYYVILMKTFMENIPASIEESAKLDGAGYCRIYYSIMMPLSKPILATIAIFVSVGQWNMFQDNLFLVHAEKLQTLQMLLYRYMNQIEAIANAIKLQGIASVAQTGYVPNPMAIRMTISMIVVFPILLVYPFLQRYFVKGIMIGAVKG